MSHYTAVVIGSGPAGYTCAIRLTQLGGKVAIVERDYVGGICTNWGCTPSKSMIESAKIARVVAEAARYGVHVPSYTINFAEVAARRDEVIRTARTEIIELLHANGVDLYQGEGSIAAPGRVRVKGGKLDIDGEMMHYDGNDAEITADHIVLGTGSAPLIPGFVDRDDPTVGQQQPADLDQGTAEDPDHRGRGRDRAGIRHDLLEHGRQGHGGRVSRPRAGDAGPGNLRRDHQAHAGAWRGDHDRLRGEERGQWRRQRRAARERGSPSNCAATPC